MVVVSRYYLLVSPHSANCCNSNGYQILLGKWLVLTVHHTNWSCRLHRQEQQTYIPLAERRLATLPEHLYPHTAFATCTNQAGQFVHYNDCATNVPTEWIFLNYYTSTFMLTLQSVNILFYPHIYHFLPRAYGKKMTHSLVTLNIQCIKYQYRAITTIGEPNSYAGYNRTDPQASLPDATFCYTKCLIIV